MGSKKLCLLAILVIFAFLHEATCRPYLLPQTLANRQTMVHLFEWKWTDIANECETFLSKYGYGAVQVSPPNEHLMLVQDGNMPWWIRYQPVSYKLESRSGTRDEFIDMVSRCNAVGVRIVVDGVVNHMVNMGQKYPDPSTPNIWSSANSSFDGTDFAEQFPAVPYTNADFNDKACDRGIENSDYINNPTAIRVCRLGILLDLNHTRPYVQQKVADYFNDLVDIGVAGVRIDAAKHMWPQAIVAILNMTNDLIADEFGADQRPFIAQEVSGVGGESVKRPEYMRTGRITNFNHGLDIAAAIRRQQNFAYFTNFGVGWGYMPDEWALVFIDNHDTQRNDPHVLTYQNDGWKYIMGVSYMLAWTYGYPRVMSSFYFKTHDDGPPTSGAPSWTITSPTFQPDETCTASGPWVCEHRMPVIRRMVTFRSVVTGHAAASVVSADHRIAFRRGTKGFFALNNNDLEWQGGFFVGLPEGSYCDVITGEYDDASKLCTGVTINVDKVGMASISVPPNNMLAIHLGQRIPTTPIPTLPPIPASFQRTVIMVHKKVEVGQSIFVRGGLEPSTHGCQNDTSAGTSKCSISIVHQTEVSADDFPAYTSWRQWDRYLDWFGGELNQGTLDGIPAQGTPLLWTTDQQDEVGYNPLNTYGPDYWLADLLLDCNGTDNGWFSLRFFYKTGLNEAGYYENDIQQVGMCLGHAATATPSNIGKNHAGKCGAINVFDFDGNGCEIKNF